MGKQDKDDLSTVKKGMIYVDIVMTGLQRSGWEIIEKTQMSQDFGVDIVARRGDVKYGIQCKYNKNTVGVRAVQEVIAGLMHYGCDRGIVITNSTFSKAAVQLADENSVICFTYDDTAEDAGLAVVEELGETPLEPPVPVAVPMAGINTICDEDFLKDWNFDWDCRWKKEWDGHEDDDDFWDDPDREPIPVVIMKPQDEIDGDPQLVERQYTYRRYVKEMRAEKNWPLFLEECYGTSAPFSLIFGLELLYDYTKEAMDELVRMPAGSHLGNDKTMIEYYLPERYVTKYDYEFLHDLLNHIDYLLAHAGDIDKAYKPIDEIIIYMAAMVADDEFGDLFENTFRDWADDLFDGCDVKMVLYSNMKITAPIARFAGIDLSAYEFEHWFENTFYVKDLTNLGSYITDAIHAELQNS